MPRLLLFVLCAALLGGCKDAAKEERRRQRIAFMHGTTGDADLKVAMEKARATVGEFLAVLQKPGAGQGQFMVRRAFPTAEKGRQQILLVNRLTYDGKLLHGFVDDRTAQPGGGFSGDGRVAFPPEEICEWMYNDNGKAVGGQMLRVFKTKFPDIWAEERYDEKIQFKD